MLHRSRAANGDVKYRFGRSVGGNISTRLDPVIWNSRPVQASWWSGVTAPVDPIQMPLAARSGRTIGELREALGHRVDDPADVAVEIVHTEQAVGAGVAAERCRDTPSNIESRNVRGSSRRRRPVRRRSRRRTGSRGTAPSATSPRRCSSCVRRAHGARRGSGTSGRPRWSVRPEMTTGRLPPITSFRSTSAAATRSMGRSRARRSAHEQPADECGARPRSAPAPSTGR
jgi:hypothetical protein